jgi:predicted RND superfamily exporter protein
VIAELEAQLATKVAERTQVRNAIRLTAIELRKVGQQAELLLAEQRKLQADAAALQLQADALEAQAAQLRAQGATLAKEAKSLQQQADALQQQADELQQQADELQQQQAAAEAEQQQAEALQQQITDELTKAGGDPRGTDPRLVKIQDGLTATAGVLLVSPPKLNKAGDTVTYTVVPTTRPADPATADLVVVVRDRTLPAATTKGVVLHVGGSTAANVDLATLITNRLPVVILTVLGLSFLLLLIAFRSLLVPVQAAVTNLICVGAAFGILTAAFQWGWALPVIGLDSPYGTVPIASYVPLMMFAALFGLSMDYEVFFVSSVQGHHLGGEDPRSAVRSGLASSAKVIVAAAAIMICVFGSFILNGDPTIKQFGVGLSSAVFLAALMVVLFAPALLVVLGETTWRLPRFLDRVLPHLDLEGHAATARVAAANAAPADAEQARPADPVNR